VEDLIVHIGTFKTGTTAIQKVLSRHRRQIEAEQGILYPTTAEIPAGGHHNLVYELTRSWKYKPESGGFEALRNEFRNSPAGALLISAENLSSYALPNPQVAPAFRDLANDIGCRLRVICYVRPQWEYIDSYYSQGAKSGYTTCSFSTFVDSALTEAIYDYEKVIAPWEALGVAVSVRPYTSGNVIGDFLAQVGISLPDSVAVAPSNSVNVRFGAKRLDFMLRMGAALERAKLPFNKRIPIARRLREIVESVDIKDVPFSGLDRETVLRIADAFQASNSRMSTRYSMGTDWFAVPDKNFQSSTFDLRQASVEDQRAFDDAVVKALVSRD
jgi:hypothetical protein